MKKTLFLGLLAAAAFSAGAVEKPALVLRFDDDKPTNQWLEIAEIFEPAGGRCSFAVNPTWLGEAQWATLRDLSKRGHEIMDHTLQHALFKLDLPSAEAAAKYKSAKFFDHVENGGRLVLCRPDCDLAHPGNVRIKASMTNGVLRSADPAFVEAQRFSRKFFVPSTGKFYGFGKDCGGNLFKKGPEQKCSDFWGRWTADSFGPCDVVLLDDMAVQPSLELLRAQAREVRAAFVSHGLPPPKTWIRPGGWEGSVDWRRMKAVYGDEFGYAVVNVSACEGLDPYSRWNYPSDFGFFDFEDDVDKVYAKAVDALACGRSFSYISHQWTQDRPKYLAKCRQLAAKLKAGRVPMTTFSHIASGSDGLAWTELFNGKDLSGWTPKIRGFAAGVNAGNTFFVKDGLLCCGYDDPLYAEGYQQRFGHLFHKGVYSNYVLRATYRMLGDQVKGGPGWAVRNNGLMLHGQTPETMAIDQNFPASVEFQLLSELPDGRPRSTANLCTPGTNVERDGKLYTPHTLNSVSATHAHDAWTTVEAEVRGGEEMIFRVLENGVFHEVLRFQHPQLDPKECDKALIRANGGALVIPGGTISIQSESAPTQFKSIRIRPL